MKSTEKFKDNYLIGLSLGSGAFGEVRKCKGQRSNAVRAVKILRKEKIGDPDGFIVQRFIHEMEVLKHLDHPNIMKLYEFYEDEKRYYLVMEHCGGGELFDELTVRGHFNELEAAEII